MMDEAEHTAIDDEVRQEINQLHAELGKVNNWPEEIANRDDPDIAGRLSAWRDRALIAERNWSTRTKDCANTAKRSQT